MAPKSTASIPVGNCEVSVEATKFACESDGNSLQISVSGNAKILVSVRKDSEGKSREGFQSADLDTDGEKEIDAWHGGKLSFVVINPKDRLLCSESRLLVLQAVYEMYNKEIPSVQFPIYAYTFLLENYCSLLLNMTEGDSEKIIAAISYQIIPADTQYAEVYLTAVNSAYHQKGVGRTLFEELRKRLQSVGVTSIICRGNEQSEGFWHKQGFVSLSEDWLDDNIHKALSFPGVSGLMILHLKQSSSAHTADSLKLSLLLQPKVTVVEVSNSEDQNAVETLKRSISRTESPHCEVLGNDVLPCIEKKIDGPQCQDSLLIARSKSNKSPEHCSSSTQGSSTKRFWEASLSSLTSKKVKRSKVDCQLGSNRDTCNSDAPKNKSSIRKDVSTTRQFFKIMLTNFADDITKANLSKVITDLGGIVTSDGSSSTHVITDKVIETLDFYTALCSGAWIVSESWLQESSREGKFLNEKPYILIDKEFELKYKLKFKTAISRAKARPGVLLKKYNVHFDRPVYEDDDLPVTLQEQRLSIIVRSAGANIIPSSQGDLPPHTIYVADEKDLKRKVNDGRLMNWIDTYKCNGDELLRCVMRQWFDLKPYETENMKEKRLYRELNPELYDW